MEQEKCQKSMMRKIDLGKGLHTPESAMSLAAQIKQLTEESKVLRRENKSLREDVEILEDAARFFAARRLKSENERKRLV
jgi:transposase